MKRKYPDIAKFDLTQRLTAKQWVLDKIDTMPFLCIAVMVPTMATLYSLGMLFTGVRLEPEQSLILLVVTVAGIIPTSLIGALTSEMDKQVRLTNLRRALMLSGIAMPRRFIKRHPLHLAAYEDAIRQLIGRDDRARKDDLRRYYWVAALIFTTKDGYQNADRIVSLVENRRILEIAEIDSILNDMDQLPKAVADGAL